MAIDEPNPRYRNIIPGLFSIPNLPKNDTSGIITAWKGINMAATNTKKIIELTFDLTLERAYAAIDENTIMIITLTTVIIIEFVNVCAKFKFSAACL